MTLEQADLQRSIERVKQLLRDSPVFDPLSGPFAFGGLRVIEVEPRMVPVIELRKGLCSPAFEVEMQRWLNDLFGVVDRTTVKRGTTIVVGNQYLMIRKDDSHLLKLMT